MRKFDSVVVIVDDDASFRRSTERLLRSAGFTVHTFASAVEFLKTTRPDVPSCVVLDVQMPELSGLDLQCELARARVQIPIIFITGHGDIPMSVRAMKAGAFEFLTKPFQEKEFLHAVQEALNRDGADLAARAKLADLLQRYRSLTSREREVLSYVVTGMLNKQIAAELGTSEVTVKIQRAAVMRKMIARSVPDLVRMTEKLGQEIAAAPRRDA